MTTVCKQKQNNSCWPEKNSIYTTYSLIMMALIRQHRHFDIPSVRPLLPEKNHTSVDAVIQSLVKLIILNLKLKFTKKIQPQITKQLSR